MSRQVRGWRAFTQDLRLWAQGQESLGRYPRTSFGVEGMFPVRRAMAEATEFRRRNRTTRLYAYHPASEAPVSACQVHPRRAGRSNLHGSLVFRCRNCIRICSVSRLARTCGATGKSKTLVSTSKPESLKPLLTAVPLGRSTHLKLPRCGDRTASPSLAGPLLPKPLISMSKLSM